MVKLPALNLTTIPDSSDNVPPGDYLAELLHVKKAISKKGKPMLVWCWKIASGFCSGLKILSFTPIEYPVSSAMYNHLSALGLHGVVDSNTDGLLGKKACLIVGTSIVVNEKTGKENQYPSVEAVLLPEAFRGKHMEYRMKEARND